MHRRQHHTSDDSEPRPCHAREGDAQTTGSHLDGADHHAQVEGDVHEVAHGTRDVGATEAVVAVGQYDHGEAGAHPAEDGTRSARDHVSCQHHLVSLSG